MLHSTLDERINGERMNQRKIKIEATEEKNLYNRMQSVYPIITAHDGAY